MAMEEIIFTAIMLGIAIGSAISYYRKVMKDHDKEDKK